MGVPILRSVMAGLTLAQAEQHLNEWLSADSACAKGQASSLGGRTLTRVDARVIRENIRYGQQMVKQLARGEVRTRGAMVPHERTVRRRVQRERQSSVKPPHAKKPALRLAPDEQDAGATKRDPSPR